MRFIQSTVALSVIGLLGVLSCGDDDPAAGPSSRYDAVPISNKVSIANLTAPVDVVRDEYGMVHVHARTIEDALRVEAYQVARDRTVQLELIRRSATGRMAELFGDDAPGLIDSDIAMRTVGLARTAKDMLEQLTPDERKWVEAYADGVSQFNARVITGDEVLPGGMIGLSQSAFQPWTAIDVLAIARFQALNLGYQADEEIDLSDFVEKTQTKLSASASDPLLSKRAGMLVDIVRFAPVDQAMPLTAFPNDGTNTMSYRKEQTQAPARVAVRRRSQEALTAAKAFANGIATARKIIGDKAMGMTGSNNWIVGPSKSATGNAMLASDPHLSLSAPSTFWMVHISVDGTTEEEKLDFAGLAFPGLPGIILGFNGNIAWGATTADYDVTDVYEETLTDDLSGVVFNGAPVPFQKVHETIVVAQSPPVEYDVLVVPHHGPVVPTITAEHTIAPLSGKSALSVRWTGHAPTKDLTAVFGMLKAKNVEDARSALRNFAIGAQNWVVADTKGDIFYTTQSHIPKRDKRAFTWDPQTFTGTLPCLTLPGDGTAEWTGAMLEEAFVPHAKNPPKGWLATANTEQVGTTLDNDPTNDKLPNGEAMYMGCWHDVGFRLGRIQERIEAVPKLTLEDMASIQGDARSSFGMKLAPAILTALDHADEEVKTPGTRKDLSTLVTSDRFKTAPLAEVRDLLTRWGTEAGYDAASGMNDHDNQPSADPKQALASKATSIFNAWLVRMVHATLDDEFEAIGATAPIDRKRALLNLMVADPKTLKTFDPETNDSALFDDMKTPAIESRDERIVSSLLDAIDFLKTRFGADMDAWRWGKLHTIRFNALIPLWKTLSIPQDPDPVFPLGFPRHGDGYNVDVASYPLPSALDESTSFSYSHGPTQRLVIEMTPNGPVARNALPGGNVWESTSPHFKDEAERWRRNQNRPVPFTTAEVVGSAEGRTVYELGTP